MNKKALAQIVSDDTGLSEKEVLNVIELTFNRISDAVAQGEAVRIVGFGEFSKQPRKGREGRNPQTGKPITIGDPCFAKFTPGSNLKKAVRGK